MAVEYAFDLARAVETIEARVPYGKPAMKLLLAGSLLYGLLWVFRGLALDFFLPAARVGVSVISGTRPLRLSQSSILTISAYGFAGVLLGVSIRKVRDWSSKLRGDVKALEVAIEKYRAMFWQPLTDVAKAELIARLVNLEKHSVQISANENPDCVELARDFRECFRLAGWNVSDRQLTGAWGVMGATGIGLFAKDTVADSLRETLFTILMGTQNLPEFHRIERTSLGTVSIDIEIWVIVGPKKLGA